MAGHDIGAWSDFGVAVVGAAAALTGLLFVAVSINLERILSHPTLPTRAGQTLVLFATPLLVSILVLVPGQGGGALGAELIGAGVLSGAALLALSRPAGSEESAASVALARVLPSVGTGGCLLAAGVSLVAGGGGGLLWIVPATVLALAGGLTNACVLLVEIQR
jgi:modulator of FtsH protease